MLLPGIFDKSKPLNNRSECVIVERELLVEGCPRKSVEQLPSLSLPLSLISNESLDVDLYVEGSSCYQSNSEKCGAIAASQQVVMA